MSNNPYGWIAYDSFFRAAFLEEGIKFALLIFFCVRLSALNEPMDATTFNEFLFKNGIILSHLVKRKESLEEQFLALTKNQSN